MDDVIDVVRRLKSQAIDARDRGDYPEALRVLREAERMLRELLAALEDKRESGDPPGRRQVEVATQLVHVLGSIGGTLRRAGEPAAAVHEYDAGYGFEADEEYGVVNSYNLVQRLVSRILLEPRALDGDEVRGINVVEELQQAREAIERQIAGPRGRDEYALADLATVQLLLDDPAWSRTLQRFAGSRPSAFAVEATEEVLSTLADHVGGDVANRMSEAVGRLETEIA